MSNHGPFSHPDIALARTFLVELRSFAHPELENDHHAQRAMCRVIDKLRAELKAPAPPVPAEPEIIDWNDP